MELAEVLTEYDQSSYPRKAESKVKKIMVQPYDKDHLAASRKKDLANNKDKPDSDESNDINGSKLPPKTHQCNSCEMVFDNHYQFKKHRALTHQNIINVIHRRTLESFEVQQTDNGFKCPTCSDNKPDILKMKNHWNSSKCGGLRITLKKAKEMYGKFKDPVKDIIKLSKKGQRKN